MTDVVSKKVRSKMMAGIKGANTKPELIIRKELFARGYRYRLHYKKLPGRPDIVLPMYRAAIQVHGCFWHKHDCHLFKWPSSRRDFWHKKLNGNVVRDKKTIEDTLTQGWRVLIIWECVLKGKERHPLGKTINAIEEFLKGTEPYRELSSIIPDNV